MISPTPTEGEASSSTSADNTAFPREINLDDSPVEQEDLPVLTDEEIKVCSMFIVQRGVYSVYMLIFYITEMLGRCGRTEKRRHGTLQSARMGAVSFKI